MQRRLFVKGAVVTIVVANGEVLRAFGQASAAYGDGPAFEPWKTWRQDAKEAPLALVRAAILSSNAFNSQPWLFKVSESKIELSADIGRNLGAFDPYLRELHFSLGCALENLLLAAAASGYKTSVTILPGSLSPAPSKPEPRLVARVDFSQGKRAGGELYQAIPNRHTNREPFDPQKPLPADFLEALGRAAAEYKDVRLSLFLEQSDRKQLIDIVAASSGFVADPDVQRGIQPWVRATMEDLQKFRDGSYVGPGGPFKPGTLEQYKSLMLSGPLFGVIAVRDRYDIPQTLRAGQVWQRAHLLATARGLAARPANGAVEIIDREKRLNQQPRTSALVARIIGEPQWQPTFMFYMGYPTLPAPPSARRSIREVLL
jgi:nitroreductase